jgi:hypothetical protein
LTEAEEERIDAAAEVAPGALMPERSDTRDIKEASMLEASNQIRCSSFSLSFFFGSMKGKDMRRSLYLLRSISDVALLIQLSFNQAS